MSCVFDTNAFCQLFDSYYRNRFPTLWERFGELVANDRITSTREIRREIGNHRVSTSRDWASENIGMFPMPRRGGFAKNGECVFWSDASHSRRSATKAWLSCWNAGDELTDERLTAYEKQFALRNLSRDRKDMIALGVADNFPKMVDGAPKRGVAPPRSEQKAISETAALAAWAGLHSFTGQYTLQVEFPKVAGGVLNRILGRPAHGSAVDINCADRETREFKFKYYPDNGMFRLNIPNEVPLVDWTREYKAGIACVECSKAEDNPHFKILKPGRSMMDIMERSFALGTWGRTPTRLYGWC